VVRLPLGCLGTSSHCCRQGHADAGLAAWFALAYLDTCFWPTFQEPDAELLSVEDVLPPSMRSERAPPPDAGLAA